MCCQSVIYVSNVYGHGYLISPIARQARCKNNPKNSIWWPTDGTGIQDLDCRAAFQYVKNRGSDPTYQFTQLNEFAVLIPQYQSGYSALTQAVPNNLCSAGASTPSAQFGDKSGMSIATKWTPTQYKIGSTSNTSMDITVTFCATATHNPSFWEFYITKQGVNTATKVLTWNDFEFFQSINNVAPTTGTWAGCTASKAYIMKIKVPVRLTAATLLARWQRIDSVGECFINCSDIQMIV
ncbi:chitinase B [Cavenderia fasciculata]|uniref:Chitinase B n=1 Tax=Cavenderia fasciculata TaxID=261658 RepID=F4PNZ4_CACFS|nr:chitinase B [Cavenderia fasciculata]EGG22673.1 chitinase B [Cavenderia fasciculata]|eukprot:XP_004360524.1 chitinase B [Cavenderia fasciculata]